MRMFLAIELPEEVRRHLVGVRMALGGVAQDVSMTRAENLHVTLKFLGEVEDRRVGELCESLGHVTGSEIDLAAEGLECFPPRGPMKIVAARMDGNVQALAGVHAAVEQRCHVLGFEHENRAYRPHVTLARARKPLGGSNRKRMEQACRELWPGPRFSVKEIVLMESRLRTEGAEYVVAARFLLNN